MKPSVVNLGGKHPVVCSYQLFWGKEEQICQNSNPPMCHWKAALEGISLKIAYISFMGKKLLSIELRPPSEPKGISSAWMGACLQLDKSRR